jgi:hypothetical protein
MTTPVVNVHLVDFKISDGDELVTENPDGSYTILINSRISSWAQREAYKHAMWHIVNGDLEYYRRKEADVQQIEAVAHDIKKHEPITVEKVPDWLKSLRKDHARVKKALLAYDRRRKFMEENGIIKPDTIHDAPISFEKETEMMNRLQNQDYKSDEANEKI